MFHMKLCENCSRSLSFKLISIFLFCFLIKCIHGKFFFRVSCQDTQNNVKRAEKWFRKNVRMDVCMCVCVCVWMCARVGSCICMRVYVLKLRQIHASVCQ